MPTNTGKDVGEEEPLFTPAGNVSCVATMEIRMRFLEKLKTELM